MSVSENYFFAAFEVFGAALAVFGLGVLVLAAGALVAFLVLDRLFTCAAAFCFAAASTFFAAAVLAVFFAGAGFFSTWVFLAGAAFFSAGAFFATTAFFFGVVFLAVMDFLTVRFLSSGPGLVGNLNEPDAPLPLVCTTAPDVTAAFKYLLMKGANFSPSTLYVEAMYFLIAWTDEPLRSFNSLIAVVTILAVDGCDDFCCWVFALDLAAFFAGGELAVVFSTAAVFPDVFLSSITVES